MPSSFEGLARAPLYRGTVKQYRLRFIAPKVKGFSWAFAFEQARRRATVLLNGRRIGLSIDPYTPFLVDAKGLCPARATCSRCVVDSRKDPRLPEGWWNWGGITRPVQLVPVGAAASATSALMSDVACKGPATRCKANC